MYSVAFLKSLGLDEKIWNAGSEFKELISAEKVNAEVVIDKETNVLSQQQSKTDLPIRYLNCVHGLSLVIGEFCDPAERFIDD